jgi:hypothetical protein
MARAINDDVAIKGSDIVIGIYFPPIDDKWKFSDLLAQDNIKEISYYIINSSKKVSVSTADLYVIDGLTDDNSRAFTVKTDDLIPGVLMVEIKVTVPAYNGIPKRTEIARCSTGIAIVE